MQPQYQQVPQPMYQQQPHPNQGYQQPMVGHNQPNPPVYYMVPAQQMHMLGLQPAQPPQEDILLQKSGFQRLNDMSGICVSQTYDPWNFVGGCDTENKYIIHTLNKDNSRGDAMVFICRERAFSCARCCLSTGCRSFKTTVFKVTKGVSSDQYEPFLELERSCGLLSKGDLKVRLVEDGRNEYLGKVTEPFSLCSIQANIYDKENTKKYSMGASCCQPGTLCHWPCDVNFCQAVHFDLKTPSGEIVSSIEKKVKGFCCRPFSGGNFFRMGFAANSGPVDKALMMAALLILDYSHFETPAVKCSDGDCDGDGACC